MKRKVAVATAGAAVTALATFGMAAPQAHAADTMVDGTVTMQQTGEMQGISGWGVASIVNNGTTTIPAGTVVKYGVMNMPGMPNEVHATMVSPKGSGELSVFPIGLNGNGLRTLKPLAPGQSFSFNWSVYHYAPWHRVHVEVYIDSYPSGTTDVNWDNNWAGADNNGEGL